MKLISRSPAKTQRIAWKIIEKESRKPRVGALCVALIGELGAGKTTLVQGIGKKLGIKQRMTSPTFLLMREFPLEKTWNGIKRVYHFDWYRLKDKKQILDLGWDDILKDSANLVLVEWADKFPKLLPDGRICILLEYSINNRNISVI